MNMEEITMEIRNFKRRQSIYFSASWWNFL